MDKQHLIENNLIRIKKTIVPIALISGVSHILQLAVPMYSLQVMDKVIGSRSLETLLVLTFVIVVAIIFSTILEKIKQKVINHIDYIFSGLLVSMVANETVSQNVIYQNENIVADNVEYFKKLHNFIVSFLVGLIEGPFVLIYLLFLFFLHPFVGFLTIFGGFLIFALTELGKILSKSSQKVAYKYNYLANNQIESIKKLGGVAQANGIIGNLLQRFSFFKQEEGLNKLDQKATQNRYNEATNATRTILQILTTGLCGYLILQDQLTTGAIIASSILSSKALTLFAKFSTAFANLPEARSAYRSLVKNIKVTHESKKPIEISKFSGKISGERLIFIYPETKKPILKGANIEIASATINLITGSSMSGKSTMLKLLAGIYKPISGMVKYDQIDLSLVSKESLGKIIGYLPQIIDQKLVGDNIRESIARLDQKANIDNVIKASQKLNCHNLINSFESGYNTKIIDNGCNLGFSLSRRIAFASTIYSDPKILILDDVDVEGEQEVLVISKLLLDLRKQGVTTIMSGKSLELLKISDKVFYLENGLIKH